MTDANNTPSPAQDLDEIRIEHPFIEFARMYIRNAAAVIGLLIFLIIVFAALFAPILLDVTHSRSFGHHWLVLVKRVSCSVRTTWAAIYSSASCTGLEPR